MDLTSYNRKPLKFWAQKILPLVYDDSLSYYEVLCKVIDYLNSMNEQLNGVSTEVQETLDLIMAELNEMKDYIEHNIETITIEYLQDNIESFVLGAEYDEENTSIYLQPITGSGQSDHVYQNNLERIVVIEGR